MIFQILYMLQCCVDQDGSGGNTSGLLSGHAGFQSQMKKWLAWKVFLMVFLLTLKHIVGLYFKLGYNCCFPVYC
jgi:hypothetical protein